MSLPWAVIPTAGRGTRLAPATDSVPKALLPVGLRPMLDWALEEALETGVQNIAVVISPHHDEVRRHVEKRHGEPEWPTGVRLHVVEQPRPSGLGDALMRCRYLTDSDVFGVVVPDNWFDAPTPALAQVAATHRRTGRCSMGLVEVSRRNAALLGNVGRVVVTALGQGDYQIERLGAKGKGSFDVGADETVLRGCARYVLGPEFYRFLEANRGASEGEWDDVPALQELAVERRLVGCRLQGRHFDVGQEAGYLAAMSYLFAQRVNDSDAEPR